jgi:hypothetical protein
MTKPLRVAIAQSPRLKVSAIRIAALLTASTLKKAYGEDGKCALDAQRRGVKIAMVRGTREQQLAR